MSKIELNTANFADVAHTGYRGTIAIDFIAHKYFDEILMPKISKYVPIGYYFSGMKIYTGGTQNFNNHSVDILLEKTDDSGETKQLILPYNISLEEMLTWFNAVEIRFCQSSDFENDRINWKGIEEIEIEEDEEE